MTNKKNFDINIHDSEKKIYPIIEELGDIINKFIYIGDMSKLN